MTQEDMVRVALRDGYCLEYNGRRYQAGIEFDADAEWVAAHSGRLVRVVDVAPQEPEGGAVEAPSRGEELASLSRDELVSVFEELTGRPAKGITKPNLVKGVLEAEAAADQTDEEEGGAVEAD